MSYQEPLGRLEMLRVRPHVTVEDRAADLAATAAFPDVRKAALFTRNLSEKDLRQLDSDSP